MTKRLLKLTGITIAAFLWAILVLKFIYPYDRVLSELAKEQRFVFLYEQQRLAEANEVTEDLLKSDKRWQYGLTSDLEVMTVTFPINKEVFFLTTGENDNKPWEDKSGKKTYTLSTRTLIKCLESSACPFVITTGLGDKGYVYARTLTAVKADDSDWKDTLEFAGLLVRANVERQELLINFKRYGVFSLPLLLLGLWMFYRGFVNGRAAKA